MVSPLGADFFARPAREVAPDLIGCVLEGNGVAGVIVEVERYEQWDAASHSFRGPTPTLACHVRPRRTCCTCTAAMGCTGASNIVCERRDRAPRCCCGAVEPTAGLDVMGERRGMTAAA